VEFSPHLPHILASASRDKSVRIWNIMGGDLAPGQTDLSANYPMGQADEGTCLVAVLGGDGLGGHRWDVCSLVSRCDPTIIGTARLDSVLIVWNRPGTL
jgi:WD40 repeat protein